MSQVENLEFTPAYWRSQVGSKVEDLEEYPLVLYPQPQILPQPVLQPVLAPSQNLTQASVLSDPAQDPVSVPSQNHILAHIPTEISIPAHHPIPTSVAYHPLVIRRSPRLLDPKSPHYPNPYQGSSQSSSSTKSNSQPIPVRRGEISDPTSPENRKRDQETLYAEIDRVQDLILTAATPPVIIPKDEEVSVQSTNSSKDRAQLERITDLIYPESVPDTAISRSYLDNYKEFDV
jgi:hypothetical protein